MIDSIFWCINTAILFLLGYYLYKTQIKAGLEQKMVEQKAKKDVLTHQVGLLQDACLRIKKETEEQEKLYADLHTKIGLWADKVATYDAVREEQQLVVQEALEKKRQQQREYDALSRYKKELVRTVVAQAAQELRHIFQDKPASDAYINRLLETMKKS